jgi:hypothetical protein
MSRLGASLSETIHEYSFYVNNHFQYALRVPLRSYLMEFLYDPLEDCLVSSFAETLTESLYD